MRRRCAIRLPISGRLVESKNTASPAPRARPLQRLGETVDTGGGDFGIDGVSPKRGCRRCVRRSPAGAVVRRKRPPRLIGGVQCARADCSSDAAGHVPVLEIVGMSGKPSRRGTRPIEASQPTQPCMAAGARIGPPPSSERRGTTGRRRSPRRARGSAAASGPCPRDSAWCRRVVVGCSPPSSLRTWSAEDEGAGGAQPGDRQFVMPGRCRQVAGCPRSRAGRRRWILSLTESGTVERGARRAARQPSVALVRGGEGVRRHRGD